MKLALGIVCLLFLLVVGPGVVKVWRGQKAGRHQYDPFVAPAAWPWGEPLWRGAYRSMLVYWAVMAAGFLTLITRELSGSLAGSLASVFAWTAIACLVLMILITAINRPKFLVPKRLRGEPGELVALFRR